MGLLVLMTSNGSFLHDDRDRNIIYFPPPIALTLPGPLTTFPMVITALPFKVQP